MAQTATITGVVFDEQNIPLIDVNISTASVGTSTDSNGYYILQITADTEIKISFSHIGHKEVILENLILTTNETYEFNPVMKTDVIQVDGVKVSELNMFKLFIPVSGAIISWSILPNESPNLISFIGMGCVFGALIVNHKFSKK